MGANRQRRNDARVSQVDDRGGKCRSHRPVSCLLAMVLLITPPSRHKQFAVWSAKKFNKTFRPAGTVSMDFGAFIVYGALMGP